MNKNEITINSIGLGEAWLSDEKLKKADLLIIILSKLDGNDEEYKIEKNDLPNELAKIFSNDNVISLKEVRIDFIEENIRKHFTEININK